MQTVVTFIGAPNKLEILAYPSFPFSESLSLQLLLADICWTT
jgi:hypothetical protein